MEEETNFAPAVRSTTEQILKEFELVGSQKYFTEIFGALTGIGAVLDENRQIVYANNDFLSLLGIESLEPILGKRTGEVISCVHATEEPSGCGTTYSCAYCGAVNAILESQRTGKRSVRETRITSEVGGKLKSWDLNIMSTPVYLAGNPFYILVLQDISGEKRQSILERIFFHDLLNAVGGLNGLLAILKTETDPEEAHELINLSEETSRDILDEILLHRQIRAAEMGDLEIKIEKVNSHELLSSAVGKISSHEVGKNKSVVISDKPADIDFETDKNLFQRVIINLLKNALEASEIENTVYAGVENEDDKIRFWVKNDTVIPKDVQMQLFHRSFSTKGTGRGIGTYSIRLLTENYLKGKVSFISNETEGTIFSIELNKKFPADIAD
jgi:signal transduction histidine kinase